MQDSLLKILSMFFFVLKSRKNKDERDRKRKRERERGGGTVREPPLRTGGLAERFAVVCNKMQCSEMCKRLPPFRSNVSPPSSEV